VAGSSYFATKYSMRYNRQIDFASRVARPGWSR
jgi:hypothetical protein